MEATDILRTTVAAVAISVAFLGGNETANARPYHHVFSCYDFAWQSQDLKDCLARHDEGAPRPSASVKASDPLRVAASARLPWKRAVAASPYNHVFSCYDFAWQSHDMKDCLAGLPLPPERPVVVAKPAVTTVATAAKVHPALGHPAASLAKAAPQPHAAPQVAQTHPHPDRSVAVAPLPTPAKLPVATAKTEKPAPRQLTLPLPPVTKAPATEKAEISTPHRAVVAKQTAPKQPHHEATVQAKPHPAPPAIAAKKEPRKEETVRAKPPVPHAPPADLVTAKAAAQKAEKRAPRPALAAKAAPKEPHHEATASAKPQPSHTPPASLAVTKPPVPARAASAKAEPRHAAAPKPVETAVQKPPAAPASPETPLTAAPRTPVFASPMPPSGSPALPQILRGQAPQDTASVPKTHDSGDSPDTIAPAAGASQLPRPGQIEQGPSGHVTIEKTQDGVEVIRGQVDHGN